MSQQSEKPWPVHASGYIIGRPSVIVRIANRAQIECARGEHDGPYHQALANHNAACSAQFELAKLWYLRRDWRAMGGGRKP